MNEAAHFIRSMEIIMDVIKRQKIIVRTSVLGIAANLVLSGFKAAVGMLAGSIAMILDAVNNLTDAMSSVITIIGTVLAGKKPDKKHPLGYGRSEYLSAMLIAAIVLYAGITSLVESIKKILEPAEVDHSYITLLVVGAAVAVKIILGLYVRKKGDETSSDSLKESGADAMFDALLSAAVFISTVIYLAWNINLEAYVSVIISVFIIKSGVGMLSSTLADILGKRMDPELISAIKKTIREDENVLGVYDLILHSYGPNLLIGSVHVEVNDSLTCREIDKMERRIAHTVFAKHGIIMTGIGIYSVNTLDEEGMRLKKDISNIVLSHEGAIQVHGYYLDKENMTVYLDIIIDFDIRDRQELFDHIKNELNEVYPQYRFDRVQDIDV